MNEQDAALVTELRGTTCRCGRPKSTERTFCGRCYHRLPRDEQLALYRLVGHGYREAYDAAVLVLDEGKS